MRRGSGFFLRRLGVSFPVLNRKYIPWASYSPWIHSFPVAPLFCTLAGMGIYWYSLPKQRDLLSTPYTPEEGEVLTIGDLRFTRLTKKLGTNEGGVFVSEGGEKFYLKFAPAAEGVEGGVPTKTPALGFTNVERFKNEYLLSKLYNACGLLAPQLQFVRFDHAGEAYCGILSPFKSDLVSASGDHGWYEDPKFKKDLLEHTLFHIIVGNYDAVNFSWENTDAIYDSDLGKLIPYYTDVGAGLKFTAEGERLCLISDARDFLVDEEPGFWFKEYDRSKMPAENISVSKTPGFVDIHEAIFSDPVALEKAILFIQKKMTPEKMRRVFNDSDSDEGLLMTVLSRRFAILSRAMKKLAKMKSAQLSLRDTFFSPGPVTDLMPALPINCLRLPEDKSKPIQLLSTGAMNPAHPGHIMMTVNAIRALKEMGYTHVSAIISPSQDIYVECKVDSADRFALSHQSRKELLEFLRDNISGVSKAERDMITVRCYEEEKCARESFMDNVEAIQTLQDDLGVRGTVVYVLGQDLFDRMDGLYEAAKIPVMVVPRDEKSFSSTGMVTGNSEMLAKADRLVTGYSKALFEMGVLDRRFGQTTTMP